MISLLFDILTFLARLLINSEKAKKALGVILAAFLWICGIIQSCIAEVISSFGAMLGSISTESFRNVSFGSIEYIGYVNAFIPITEFIGLMSIYLTIWGTVILLRWVKSFIPTLAN